MPYVEKPASRRGRIGWAAIVWVLLLGPFTVLMFFWFGWWALLVLVALAWMTYGYVRGGPGEGWEKYLG